LIEVNTAFLEQGLTQTKLSQIGQNSLQKVANDQSPFERSTCAWTDSVVPPNCTTGVTQANQKRVALIGDSKMAQFAQPIIEYFSKKGWQVSPYVMLGCNLFVPEPKFQKNCVERSNWVLADLKDQNFDIVLAAVYPTSVETLPQAGKYIDAIITASKRTILLAQFPRVSKPKECMTGESTYSVNCSAIIDFENRNYINYKQFLFSKENQSTTVMDTTKWTCIESSCPIISGDEFIIRDGSHLSYSFVKRVTPIINLTLDSITD
jgi:hypothetical protein